MAKKKKEQKVSISQGDEAQAQAVLERYHKLAGELRSSKDQNQAEEAVSTVSDLPEAAQMALLKALSREYHQDAADVLVAVNALSQLKSLRKEARHVQEGVNFRVERLGVDGGDGRAVFPGDAEVFARRGVGRERDDLTGIAARAGDVLRQTLAGGSAEGV